MNRNYHSLELKSVLASLKTTPDGLTGAEAKKRQLKWGANELPHAQPHSKLRLFFNQLNSPLVWIIVGTVIASLILRHYSDTAIIILVLLINIVVGFYQENKAGNAIQNLSKLIKIRARVLRDGREVELESRELVPGDVIILHAGDKVPADSRLLEQRGLKINEASLTGESIPADKKIGQLPARTELGDRTNMIFMGTVAEEGFGRAVITSIGLDTEMGEIVTLLSETEESETPLQKQMSQLAKLAAGFVVAVILIIMGLGFARGQSTDEILLASLSLAVSAIPSGLLPAITIILVLGMRRILKQNGLVRKLVANETLGSVTVICTDKTGTLTQGKMEVTHIITATKELTGAGLLGLTIENADPSVETAKQIAKTAVLNNDAYLENPEAKPEHWVIRGKTTEQALLKMAARVGFSKRTLDQEEILLDKLYFSSELKYSASLRQFDGGQANLFVIGAPEVVLAQVEMLAGTQGRKLHRSSSEFQALEQRINELTAQGLRVVAAAVREFPTKPKYKKLADLAQNLTLLGLIALEDPVRSEVVECIKTTNRAGIKTVIVTGDHKLTALAIAKQIGITATPECLIDGQELEALSDEQLKSRVASLTIFARVSPKHKLRIVDAFKAQGEIVAMVGDGVNDAPALKAADIGIAVASGTDVAKEVADLVLLDNGFHTIVKAIQQGRVIFANIRKVFIYLVADDFSELFLFLTAMIMGLPLPLLPAQILWINLVEDGLPDLSLTTEQELDHLMDQPPRKHGEPILNGPLKKWLAVIFFVSGFAALFTFIGGLWFVEDINKVRTIVFALMGLDSLVFVFSTRSLHRTIFRRDIFSNRWLLGAVGFSFTFLLLAIYAPFMHRLLSTRSLNPREWLVIGLISLTEILLIEAAKKIFVAKKHFQHN